MDIIQQFISEDLIYALGWTVIHSLWQAFLIAITMALVMQVFKKKSSRVRYEVSALALFLVLISSLCTFIWYLESPVEAIAADVVVASHEPIISAIGEASFMQGFTQSCIDYFNTHLPMIVLIWLAGVGFFVLRLFGGLAYVQRLRYHRNTILSPYWQQKVQSIASRIPVKKTVEICESAAVKVPLVIGYFKPLILLPVGAINQLDEQEIEAIIAHELAHVFRNDFLMNILISFVEVLFYYNPAVWWISGNIRLERENSCDDLAIKLCGNSLAYAKSLVRLQELNAYSPSFAMPFSGQKNQLLNRIKRILNQPQNRNNIMEKLAATCFLLLAIIFMSVSANTPENKNETQDNIESETEVFFTDSDENVFITKNVVRDTTPEMKRIMEAETLDIRRKNGEITELIIDGEKVSKDELQKYSELITEYGAPPAPPAPPTPPSPPGAVSVMPAPSAPNAPVPPTGLVKPSPPTPPAPPAPFIKYDEKRITKEKNEDGQTMIIIESEGTDPVEIILEELAGPVIVNGDQLQDGETAVIVEKLADSPNIFMVRDNENRFFVDSTSWPEVAFYRKQKSDLHEAQANQELALMYEREYQLRNKENQMRELRADKEKMQLMLERSERMEGETKQRLMERAEREKEISQLQKKRAEEIMLLKRKIEKERSSEDRQRYEMLLNREKEQMARSRELFADARQLQQESLFNRFEKSKAVRQFSKHLLADGLIDDISDFNMTLSRKKLKVNGKKHTGAKLKKYLELYEGIYGKELGKKDNYSINLRES